MSATTGNFIEGGTVDPFRATGAPLTLAEQAALEEQRRQQRLQESARNTANVNNRPGGYNTTAGRDQQDSVDASNRRVVQDRKDRDRYGSRMRLSFGEALSEDPVTMGILAGPLLTTGAGLAVGGPAALGFGLGEGSIAGGGAGAVQVANEATGLATAGPGFSQEAANAYNAANAASAFGGTTTTAAAAAPAAGEAFSVGGALKEVAPILSAVGPMAIDALAGGRTKEEQALVAKQKQMAQEAEARRAQVQESRMNALGQQLLAFNPTNQMMARMFGPDAAFQPEEMAAMVQNPIPPPQLPPEASLPNGDPRKTAALQKYLQDKQRYEQGNQQRTDQMTNGMRPVGPGPAPLQQRTPQAARKY